MTAPRISNPTVLLVAAAFLFASSALAHGQTPSRTPGQIQSDSIAAAKARADSARRPYTKADIDFLTGMIHHHAQAILMAGWAPTHTANPDILTLCARIVNAQKDEITIMQQWLRNRGQPVPTPDPHGMKMVMDGMEHRMLMPGMLTDDELKQLDQARGADFDRLFLTGMIKHHQGAVGMVKQLIGTSGAAQDDTIFKLASDINVDQTTEIARMQKMLVATTLGISL